MSDLMELEMQIDELDVRCRELEVKLNNAQRHIADQFIIMSALAKLIDFGE